jgi:hypothetical protein
LHEPGTGKFFIEGTFSVLSVAEFPVIHPTIAVYYAATNGHGDTAMKVRLVDAEEHRAAIFELETKVRFPDPLATVESVAVARGVVFAAPGEYRVQLWGAGQLLKERRLILVPSFGMPLSRDEGEE